MNPLSERLRSRREELTLSVKEISARTKIRPNVINALEEGKFDVLPRVYITSFIKNYCTLLEISDEELDELWVASGLDNPIQEPSGFSLSNVLQSGRESTSPSTQSGVINSQPKPPSKIKLVQPSPRIISAIVYSAFVLGCSALIYYFLIRETPLPKKTGESVPTAEIRPDSGEGGLLSSLFEESLPKDSIILEATATDSVWLTINADGTKSDQLLMTTGSSKRWSAKTQFILSLGNAGAIELKRNNIPLPSLGKKGTALRFVKITKDEVNTSASPYKNQDSLARLAAIAAEKKAAALKETNAKKPTLKSEGNPIKVIQQQSKQITQSNQESSVKQSSHSKTSTQPTEKNVPLSSKQAIKPATAQSTKQASAIVSPTATKQGNPLKIAPPTRKNKLLLKNNKLKGKQQVQQPKKKQGIPIITPAPLKSPGYKP